MYFCLHFSQGNSCFVPVMTTTEFPDLPSVQRPLGQSLHFFVTVWCNCNQVAVWCCHITHQQWKQHGE